MNLEKAVQRIENLSQKPGDLEEEFVRQHSEQESARLAQDLGHELPHGRVGVLRQFRAMASEARDQLVHKKSRTAGFAEGTLFSLTKVCAAYERELNAVVEREAVEALARRPVHSAILRALEHGAKLPGELVKGLGKSKAQISRALKDLREADLVENVGETEGGDQRERPHRITPTGSCTVQPLGACRWSAEQCEVFREFGIDPQALTSEAVPEEIRRAADRFLVLAEREAETFGSIVNSEQYFEVPCPYSQVEQLEEVRYGLAATLRESNLGRMVPYTGGTHFDAILRQSSAKVNRAVYLFPFFLTEQRRAVWGVIPYAYQRLMGVLLHKEHPSLTAWRKVEQRKKKGCSKDEHAQAILEWLVQLVLDTKKEGGRLLTFSGYIFDEVIAAVVSRAGNEDARIALGEILTSVDSEGETSVPHRMLLRDTRGKIVFLFDPAEKPNIKAQKLSNYKIVEVSHGLTIPVGVGFTLYMLPKLLAASGNQEDCRRVILDKAWGALAEARKKLANIGIELMPDLFPSEAPGAAKVPVK